MIIISYYLLKQGIYWTHSDEGICIYFTNQRLKTLINSNNNEQLFSLLNILKTPKSIEELYLENPFENIDDLKESLTFLSSNQLVEILDKKDSIPNEERRISSYVGALPNVMYSDYKNRINQINTCLLGLGTAGSYIPEVYFKMGFSKLTLIDYDLVEDRNIQAQNFSKNDIGKSKMDVLVNKYNTEFPNSKINGYHEKITSFEQFHKLIDITTYDYLLMYADDYDLTIELIENTFKVNEEIKIILSGYSVFEVESLMVTKENYEVVLEGLKKDLIKFKSLKGVIVDNSGTILESYLIAFSTLKIMMDNTLGINQSEYMAANFLNNSYFLGSQFEFLYNREQISDIKNELYNFEDNDEHTTKSSPWISEITLENVLENNILVQPELDQKMKNYIYAETSSQDEFNEFLKLKSILTFPDSASSYDIYAVKKNVLEKFLCFAKQKYSQEIFEIVENLIKHSYIYTFENKYGSKKPQAIKNSKNVFVYAELSQNINSFNDLIHELFHTVFYLNGNYDIYYHEDFVFKQ